LRLFNQRADVAPAHFGGHDDAALAILPTDLIGTFREVEGGELTQWDGQRSCPGGGLRQGHRQIFQRIDIVAHRIGQTHNDLEAAVAFEHQPGCASADGNANDILNVRKAQAVARNLSLVDLDVQERQARHLLDLDVLGPFHPPKDGSDSTGHTQHRAEIVTEYLDRQILPHPGDQLVETHLNWL
jgi:hypothetical protein